MDSSSSTHLDTSWQSLSTPAAAPATSTTRNSLDASTKAVMHVVDERGRCLFHPHIILRKKAILGKMGGWKDVLPACPECEKEDTQGGLSLGSAGSSTKGGLSLVVAQLQQTQAAVESSKREGGIMGSDNNDDDTSSSSSSFDNDSSSLEDDESSSSESQSSDERGHDQIVDDEVYDKGEDVNIKTTSNKQNRWVVGKQWARRAEKLRILNDRVKEKLREEMRTAANDLAMDAKTNDADFVQAYMSSGSASGGLVQQRQRQQHSTSSMRLSANHRRVVSDITDSSSSRLAISHQRRSTDSPFRGTTQQQRKKLDTSDRSSGSSPSRVIAQHQQPQHLRRKDKGLSEPSSLASQVDTSERSGASDSSPSNVIAQHQPQNLRRKGNGVSESSSAAQRRRRFATTNYDDDMMDQYGDDGKMKKIFNEERTHRAPPLQISDRHRGKESRRQLQDGRHREGRKSNPEQTALEKTISRKIKHHRTRDTTERRPNKSDLIDSATSEKPLIREGRKALHGTNRSRLERKDLRGAVPNVKSFDSDVAAYQWDKVPPSEFENVLNEFSTKHDTKKNSSEDDDDDDDSQRDVLDAVSYQWDRMPIPGDESFMQSTPTLYTRDDLRIQREVLLEKAKTNSWNGQSYRRQSKSSDALSVEDLLSLSPGVLITEKDDKAERTVSDLGDNTEASGSIEPPFDQSSVSLGGNETAAENECEALDPNPSPNHDTSNLRISISSVEDEENEKILCSTVDRETKIRSSDFTSSTDNIYDTSYRSGEELAEEEGEEKEEENHQLTVVYYPVTSSETPLNSSENYDLTNSCVQLDSGDFKIDLTSLQASKPSTGHKINLSLLRASQPGGLQIDLSALQAYKPVKKQEIDSQDQFMQSERTEISDIKTFTVVDLPFTGKLGESGMYSGSVSEQYQPHGKGIMLYDTGELIKGYWSEGDLIRECKLYETDSEGDDDGDDGEEDLSSSMSNVRSKDRGRSRSRSKDQDALAASPSPPPLPEYKVGDSGSRSDMITDKDEASLIIEQLGFGDGA